MDFKNILGKLDQLHEADMKSRKIAGKAYGGSAQADDAEDDEDGPKKAAAPAVKRGRGRPRKDSGEAHTKAAYGGAEELQRWIVGSLPKKSKDLEKLPKSKHKLSDVEPTPKKKVKESLKDWIAELDMLSESEVQEAAKWRQGYRASSHPAGYKHASGEVGPLGGTYDTEYQYGDEVKVPVQRHRDIPDPLAGRAGQKLSTKGTPLTPKNATRNLKGAIKSSLGKHGPVGQLPEAEQVTMEPAKASTQVIKQGNKVLGQVSNPQLAATIKQAMGKGEMSLAGTQMREAEGEKWIQKAVKHPGAFTKKAQAAGKSVSAFAKEKAHAPGTLGKQARLAQTLGKISKGKVSEADMPPNDALASPLTLEEGSDHRLKAAHHRGKAHALAKEGYNCRYDEGSEEARMYHEGYKMGLDECYGVMPMRGVVVGEESPVVDDMASFGAVDEEYGMMEDDMEEGNAFTAALAKTPHGGEFSVGGKTFTDTSKYDSNVDEMMAFEGWDKQLNNLLTEGEVVEEGMSVSVSKGQQGMPDSVSITASDAEADKLLALVKQLGVLGAEEQGSQYGSPESSGDVVHQHGDLTVVDDHDGMMGLIKKMSGGEEHSHDEHDYADEHGHEEETCGGCGMPEAECGCEESEEPMMGEEESEDQQEFEVSEDNAPDSDEAETSADENAEAQEDKALAVSDDNQEEKKDDDEEELDESFANSADDTFEADMEFMTKVISGGLNGPKSTGQTTVPVIAHQNSRMGVDGMKEGAESIADWKKLAGL